MQRIIFITLLFLFYYTTLNAQQNGFCILEDILIERNNLTKIEFQPEQINSRAGDALYIRTVVHVVYNSPQHNYSVSFIDSLIEELNLLWSAQNIDTSLIHPDHKPSLTNTEIQFCLAQYDPIGNQTNGITYTETDSVFFQQPNYLDSIMTETVKQDSLGGKSAWDTDKYFNIWIAPMGSNSSNTNYGLPHPNYFPLGVEFEYGIGTQGAVLDVKNFEDGINPPAAILAHEIGHAFGLFHIWG